MEPVQYEALLRAQGYRCCICGVAEPQPTGEKLVGHHRVLCIDHDHRSGAVRGALCHRCNTAIGLLKDDPALLRAAASYLETFLREAAA
jgi:hypothetical protein